LKSQGQVPLPSPPARITPSHDRSECQRMDVDMDQGPALAAQGRAARQVHNRPSGDTGFSQGHPPLPDRGNPSGGLAPGIMYAHMANSGGGSGRLTRTWMIAENDAKNSTNQSGRQSMSMKC